MAELGPVSKACVSELRELARQRGIVVWLDRESSYSGLASSLADRHRAGDFDVPVLGFGGSYLELLFQMEGLEDGVGMVPLIVHVPGLTEEDVRTTPLFEVYRAGQRHRRALPTLIREAAHGRASAEDIEAFVGRGDLTLNAADLWLANYDSGSRGAGPDLSAFGATALFDAVRPGGALAERANEADVVASIWQRAAQLLGVTEEWRTTREAEVAATALSAQDMASFLASELAAWSMCVEFVDDLRRPPKEDWLAPLATLATPFVRASRELAVYLRERHSDFYAKHADELERRLVHECEEATAADLGRIDTFRFEDQKVMIAGLEALSAARFDEALEFATQRTDGRSFWTQRDRSRRLAWQLVELSARLGLAVAASEGLLDKCNSVADASVRYAESGSTVDRCHRLLEQAWQQAPLLDLDEFATVRQRIDGMRQRYRSWADTLTTSFSKLCQKHSYLPSSDYQQRRLFDDVVQPWAAEDGVTAYFLVDALRYEMGAQLVEAMGTAAGGDVIIKPRLAELPTITEVGMNILAPVCDNGKLRPDITDKVLGFRTGEVRVSTPDARRKAMHQRVGGDTCPGFSLEEVVARDVGSLKKSIARARLVVVHCEGIDKAGEKGVGLVVFERELQNIRAAWNRLYEAGVKRFVISADHGFLLHDPVTRNPLQHGKKTDPKRRHVISKAATSRDGEICVSSTQLDYECDDVHFLFPADAAPFDTGEKAKDFVHGGNSLQERVIPVITIQHRYKAGAEVARYQFEANILPQVAHMHCVRVRLVHEGQTTMLAYGGRQKVEVTLECVDAGAAQLELVDVRDAEHRGNVITTVVDGWFEVFFRVTSDRAERVRVRLAHATGASAFEPYSFPERFDTEVRLGATAEPEPVSEVSVTEELAWLTDLPEEGVRSVFRHIAKHGLINETDATAMLGGPRSFRSFSRKLDTYVAVAPFRVRVEVASGVKCYVRGEG